MPRRLGSYTIDRRPTHLRPAREPIDWIEYRHWEPDRGQLLRPVSDFIAYNGGEFRARTRSPT